MDCGDLDDPENGQVSLTGTTFGSSATYTCNRGFELVGSRMRMCLASGEWMGDAPTCERKHFMFTSMHYCHAKTLLSRTQLSIVVILMILRMDRSASLGPHLAPELPTPVTEDLNCLEAA